MWILLRIMAAVCGALYRYLSAFWRRGTLEQIGDLAYFEKQKTNKRGGVTYHRIGVPLTVSVCVAFTRESRIDRFFKLIGLSREFQTGDREFDEHIYIASDHLEIGEALRDDAGLRKRIHDMLTSGFNRIWSNGHMLYAAAREQVDTDVWVPRLDQIRSMLANDTAKAPGRFRDPFFWRALVVECVVWGMAGYAAGAVADYFFRLEDVHLERGRLLLYGAVCAAIVALGLLTAIVLFLRRSSRSHRILVESALLLVLSTPVLGVQLAADFNRGGVGSGPVVVQGQVIHRWRERHRAKRATWYSHHMKLGHVEGEVPLSGEHEVSAEVYYSLSEGATIPIELGRGRLGLHWFKRINGVPVQE